jgi:hypothetical protein
MPASARKPTTARKNSWATKTNSEILVDWTVKHKIDNLLLLSRVFDIIPEDDNYVQYQEKIETWTMNIQSSE